MGAEAADMHGVAQWLERRRHRSLARVRLAALGAAALLLLAAGWIAWREAGLLRLPQAAQAEIQTQEDRKTVLTLKRVSLIVHLAKVRSNTLLADLTAPLGLPACKHTGDCRTLPEDHPCRVLIKAQLALLWQVALAGSGPPLEQEFLADSWGSPYVMDFSEAACGNYGAWCPTDALRSPGRDGTFGTSDDIVVTIPQHLARDFQP